MVWSKNSCLQIGAQVIWWALSPQEIFWFDKYLFINSYVVYKVLQSEGIELLDSKIVLVKSLNDTYNSWSRNTPVSYISRRELLPAIVPLHFPVLQTTNGNVDTAILERLRKKHKYNIIHVLSTEIAIVRF